MQSAGEVLEARSIRAGVVARVLVVDDSRAQRQLLSVFLRRWGFEVIEAASAEEALDLSSRRPIDIVISDWMMPGMSGVEFCRKFRSLPQDDYVYFILLTSKSAKSEVASGLEAGADDFVTKPVSSDELRARLHAGLRIKSMQAEVVEKSRVAEQALTELQRLYDSLDRDLIEARKLQQTLVRDRFRDFGQVQVAMMVRASGLVGGDLVGCFRLDEERIACYSVDVSGHGVASAMMTARLAGYLSAASPDQNLAFQLQANGLRTLRSPSELCHAFNELLLKEFQVEQYFTMAYAEINQETGQMRLVQAGHPHPVVLRAGGKIEKIGDGGLPIGLLPGATYQDVILQLNPGDRLFLLSDGITECPGPNGADLGEEGLEHILERLKPLASTELLEAVVWDLTQFAGTDRFPDDVSGLIADYR